jgi:hypothetical protein
MRISPSLENLVLPIPGRFLITPLWKIRYSTYLENFMFPILWKSWYPYYVATIPPYIFFRGPLLHTIDLNIGVMSEFRGTCAPWTE